MFLIFFSLKIIIDERKIHNMHALLLDLRYKNIRNIFTFVGKELGIVVIEKCDKKNLFPMLLKPISFGTLWLLLNLWQKKQVMNTLTLTFLDDLKDK
jgi:hypothetical protein